MGKWWGIRKTKNQASVDDHTCELVKRGTGDKIFLDDRLEGNFGYNIRKSEFKTFIILLKRFNFLSHRLELWVSF